jgi:hypothetical protein
MGYRYCSLPRCCQQKAVKDEVKEEKDEAKLDRLADVKMLKACVRPGKQF